MRRDHPSMIKNLAMALAVFWVLISGSAIAETVRIHYQRPAQDYTGWGVHLWGDGLAPNERTSWQNAKLFTGVDEYGRYVEAEVRDPAKPIGFIVHLGDVKDVATDRSFTPSSNREIWLRQGDPVVYAGNPDQDAGSVTIHYQRPGDDYEGWGLHLWGNAIAGSEATTWDHPRSFEGTDGYGKLAVIRLRDAGAPVNFIIHRGSVKDVVEDRKFVSPNGREVWLRQDDPEVHFSKSPNDPPMPERLGVTYTLEATTFAVWSPDSSEVELWLDGTLQPMRRIPDANGYSNVYAVKVAGDHHLKKYHFVIGRPSRIARDPYAVMVEPGTDNCIVLDLKRTEPVGGWASTPALAEREDAIIYEVHVRDFTIDANSGVAPEKRGKFLGMVQRGTRLNNQTTGLDHLVELGVTHVQLLPIYDFKSCSSRDPDNSGPNCYNWGYDPENFNVPEERYVVKAGDPVERVRELKTMINELHKAGIRVIMDVVYNHTAKFGVGGETTFSPITNRYFLPRDLSGTGNAVNASEPMVGRFIRDSLEYWVKEYHIDGFRFDLLGVFDYAVVGDWGRYLNQHFPDRTLVMYGEPWNGGGGDDVDPDVERRIRLGTIARINDAHVGVFTDQFRQAIKGESNNGHGGGFAFNQADSRNQWRFEVGTRGSIRASNNPQQPIDRWDPMFAADPEQTINYVSAHDNLTLRDKILDWAQLNNQTDNPGYLKRIQEFAGGIVLTSQGIPFIHAGAEMLRTKQGVHDSYRSPDSINEIRWNWKVDNSDVFAYYKNVIGLRRAHSGFRMNTWDEIKQNVTSFRRSDGVLVNTVKAAANGDSWPEMIVIYNSANNFNYTLPPGEWQVALEKSDPSAGQDRVVTGSVVAEGTAVTVLHRSNPVAGFDWRNAVVYYAFTDRLADGITTNNHAYGRELNRDGTEVDGYKAKSLTFHGGDFKGLTDKINSGYFNDLGVTALWVGAPYEQIHGWISSGSTDGVTGKRSYAFHGYWPLDFTETDQNYGTAAEFQTVVDAAHAKGIRIVMDVVMNHLGYITLKDMKDFGFGQFKTDAQGHEWQMFYYNNALDGHFTNDQESQYIDSTLASRYSWNRWYGIPWGRAGLPDYEPLGGYRYVPGSQPTPEQFLKGADQFGLPDFKTEETVSLGLPLLLQSKWGATKTAAEDAAMTDFVNKYSMELGSTEKTVQNYLIKWLTDWVEKYGIDGFRCDTAANVEKEAWKRLKAVAKKRFNAWKIANPSKKLDDSLFWMVGERGDRDPPAADENNPYYQFGFDAMIDFEYWGSFPSKANLTSWSGLESIFHSYSRLSDANPMSMISNHDYGMYWKSKYDDDNDSFGNALGDADLQKKAGTLLLLTPRTVNLLYGDEAGRDPGLVGSDLKDYRTDFEPTENLSTVKLGILNHWKKLGQFRKAHPAVGAGIHTKLKDSPYTFQRVLGDDKIIVVLGAQGDVTVDVSGLFANGTTLRDAYTGTVKTVSAGTVTFTVDQNKPLLLEQQI